MATTAVIFVGLIQMNTNHRVTRMRSAEATTVVQVRLLIHQVQEMKKKLSLLKYGNNQLLAIYLEAPRFPNSQNQRNPKNVPEIQITGKELWSNGLKIQDKSMSLEQASM